MVFPPYMSYVSGLPGFKGERDAPGLPGLDGQAGTDGLPGRRGEPGLRGADGLTGRVGESGIDGLPGLPGEESESFIWSYYRPRRPILRPHLVAVAEATWQKVYMGNYTLHKHLGYYSGYVYNSHTNYTKS